MSTVDCPICLAPLRDKPFGVTTCGHAFHIDCWNDYKGRLGVNNPSCCYCEQATTGFVGPVFLDPNVEDIINDNAGFQGLGMARFEYMMIKLSCPLLAFVLFGIATNRLVEIASVMYAYWMHFVAPMIPLHMFKLGVKLDFHILEEMHKILLCVLFGFYVGLPLSEAPCKFAAKLLVWH